MKSLLLTLAWIFVIGWALLAFSSCATVETTTTTTAPDGTVTVIKSKSTAPDADSVQALSSTAQAFAPRAVVINPAK